MNESEADVIERVSNAFAGAVGPARFRYPESGWWYEQEGKEIATYIVHYADKTDEKIPVKYGEDVRDWWVNPDRNKLTNAKVAWTGSNEAASAMDRKVALYAVVWKNPHPEKQVSTIDFVSKNTMCDPFLVALSLEKAEAK